MHLGGPLCGVCESSLSSSIAPWLFLGKVTKEGSTSVLGAPSGGNAGTPAVYRVRPRSELH